MFDFHVHSRVSFDGKNTALEMALAAREKGLAEICFTDHIDYTPEMNMVFDTAAYRAAYETLEVPGLVIRKGMEFGLEVDNRDQLRKDLERYPFDFVLGSVHLVEGEDVYLEPFWREKTVEEAVKLHLEQTLKCVSIHTDYDVLGHLTFISKARANPTNAVIRYADHWEVMDAILEELVRHGKGLEVNTSGIDRCGGSLPTMDVVRRFRELGGKIVTIGSDAHDTGRVGQYVREMEQQVKEIFGYVCSFRGREPVFHR